MLIERNLAASCVLALVATTTTTGGQARAATEAAPSVAAPVGPEIRLGPVRVDDPDEWGVTAGRLAEEVDARALEQRLAAVVDSASLQGTVDAAFGAALCERRTDCEDGALPGVSVELVRYGVVVLREGWEPTWRYVGRVIVQGDRPVRRTLDCHVHLEAGPAGRVLHGVDDIRPLDDFSDDEIRAAFDEIARRCAETWGVKARRLVR